MNWIFFLIPKPLNLLIAALLSFLILPLSGYLFVFSPVLAEPFLLVFLALPIRLFDWITQSKFKSGSDGGFLGFPNAIEISFAFVWNALLFYIIASFLVTVFPAPGNAPGNAVVMFW